mgnify:CR=1 FL=1
MQQQFTTAANDCNACSAVQCVAFSQLYLVEDESLLLESYSTLAST